MSAKYLLPGSVLLLLPVVPPPAFTQPPSVPAPSVSRSRPLMLVSTWKPGQSVSGWWVSEKFDGIRALWTGSELQTRNGHRIEAPDWFTADLPQVPLDGELWVGRGQFARTLSIVRDQVPGPGWKEVRFWVFDAPEVPGALELRWEALRQWTLPAHVTPVPQERLQTEAELQVRLEALQRQGGEGLVLRRPQSRYTSGRSQDWLKVKPYEEGEAVVLRHLPGKGKHTGRLGSLEVQLPDGAVFRLGTGFSDAEREVPPPVGSTVEFRYSGRTRHGLPRFAVFLREHEEW